VRNYVAFSDKDIRVDEHIKFSKPGDLSPDTPQSVVEEKIDREAEELTEPKLSPEESEKQREMIRSERNIILDNMLHVFGWKLLGIEKARSRYHMDNQKDDIGIFGKILRTPIWLAKKFKGTVIESIIDAAVMMSGEKAKLFKYLAGDAVDILKNLRRSDKAMYKKVNDYIVQSDRDATGAGKVVSNKDKTEFTAITADGKVIGKFQNIESAWEALFENEARERLADGTLDERGAETLLAVRKAFRRTLLQHRSNLLRMLREAGIVDADSTAAIIRKDDFSPENRKDMPDEINLLEMLEQMGERSGYYFPRKRIGNYQLIATKQGMPTIRKGFLTSLTRQKAARDLEKEGYTVRFERTGGNADMLHEADPMVLSDVINQAFTRAGEALKKQIQLEESKYTRKDGTTEKQLLIKSDLPFSSRMQMVIKDLGGRFYDGAWRFSAPSADTKTKLEEIIKNELAQDMRSSSILRRAVADSLVEMIRENGSSSSKIARREAVGDDVVRGYIEDLEDAFNLHIGSVAGGIARNIMAKKMLAAWNGMDFDRDEFINKLIPEDLEKGSEEYKKALLDATTEYYREIHRRALDSSKQPELVKYMDKYIKDMLRNPSDFETALGFMKGLAAVRYLASIRSAFGNLFGMIATVPAEIANETGVNPLWANKKILQGLYLYSRYHRWGKYGEGSKLPPLEFKIMDIIHQNGWDEANQTADAANESGKHAAYKWWNKVSGGLLLAFGQVEQFNRAASIYASLEAIANKRGIELSKLNDADLYRLMKEAKKISDLGNGVYNKANKPTWARGSDLAAIADTAMLFQTYTLNQYNMFADMFRNHKFSAIAYLTLGAMAMGGMSSNALSAIMASVIGGLFNPDDEEDNDDYFYNTMIRENFGDKTAEVFRYGLPALLNINYTGTFQDPIASKWTRGFTGKEGSIELTEFPALSTLKDVVDAVSYHYSGQHLKGLEKSPLTFAQAANVIRSFREASEGVTDRAGRKRKDINDEYIEPDTGDTALRFLGFNPVGISEKTDRVWSEKKVQQKYSDMRKDMMSEYRDIVNDGTPEDLADLVERIEEYNAKVRRSKRNIPFIDETMLKNALKDKDNKFFVENLDKKAQQRRDKKAKGKIVIRNGKLVRE
jgi:hypothetical protein